MTFYEYLEFAWRYYVQNPNKYQRKGQALFNALYKVHPGLADKVRATPLDPFYQDDRIPDFLTMVKGAWNNE
jgi:hypothetical protein